MAQVPDHVAGKQGITENRGIMKVWTQGLEANTKVMVLLHVSESQIPTKCVPVELKQFVLPKKEVWETQGVVVSDIWLGGINKS